MLIVNCGNCGNDSVRLMLLSVCVSGVSVVVPGDWVGDDGSPDIFPRETRF